MRSALGKARGLALRLSLVLEYLLVVFPAWHDAPAVCYQRERLCCSVSTGR